MPFSDARGPTHARHLAATMYRNEDYFFQTDSHSKFRQASQQPMCSKADSTEGYAHASSCRCEMHFLCCRQINILDVIPCPPKDRQ